MHNKIYFPRKQNFQPTKINHLFSNSFICAFFYYRYIIQEPFKSSTFIFRKSSTGLQLSRGASQNILLPRNTASQYDIVLAPRDENICMSAIMQQSSCLWCRKEFSLLATAGAPSEGSLSSNRGHIALLVQPYSDGFPFFFFYFFFFDARKSFLSLQMNKFI